MKQIRKRLTYANVMSSIAVFLVLGGATAFAAAQLGKNTVGVNQLKKNAVNAAKIKNNAVTSAKIANGSVITAKLADGSVVTAKIIDGAVTTGKIANNAVTTAKLADKAVGTGQLNEGAVTTGRLADLAVNAGKLAENSVNTTKIVDGQVRANDLGPTIIRSVTETGVPTGTAAQVLAVCQSGERAISGGGLWSGSITEDKQIQASFPSTDLIWATTGRNNSGATRDFTAFVLCLQ
jgi:hypothetical protein